MNTDNVFSFIAQTETGAPDMSTSAPAGSPQAAAPQGMMGGLGQMLPLILIFAILYFIMIRPAQRKEKERKKEINEMRAGTKVLFGGRIIGVITEVKEATFHVKVANDVGLEIARGAVQSIVPDNASPSTEDIR